MSIENFDFDISNYDRSELLEILKLREEVNINPTEVRVAAANMLSSLSSDKNMRENDKQKVRQFLNKAVNKILFVEDTNENNTFDSNSITPSNAFKGIFQEDKIQNDYENSSISYISSGSSKQQAALSKVISRDQFSAPLLGQAIYGNKNITDEVGSHFLISPPRPLNSISNSISDDGTQKLSLSYNAPGNVNPSNTITITKGLNLDSRFRDNYYQTSSTDYYVTLPTRIKKAVSMQFSNLELPLTYYSFSRKQQNVTFNILITQTDGLNVKYVCKISEGNYGTVYDLGFGTTSLRKGLEAEINAAMYGAGIQISRDLCFRVDTVSGRSVFALPMDASGASYSIVDSFEVQFAVDNDGNVEQTENLQLRLGWQLGFRCATYKGGPSFSTGLGAAVVSEGIFFPRSPRYFLLAIDDFNTGSVNDYYISAFQSSLFPPNILTRLDIGPLRDSKGSYTLANSSGFVTQLNTVRNYFGPVTIEKLRITLYDEYGRVVDLNNMDWSFSLAFTCLYD